MGDTRWSALGRLRRKALQRSTPDKLRPGADGQPARFGRALRRSALPVLIGLTLVAGACGRPGPGGGGPDRYPEPTLPIVFVHGGSGSAAQYETQALRFASNDYPNLVEAIDRISATPEVINPILDDFFDEVLAKTGDEQLYVVGHSQGVFVMNNYLDSSPERAARVAKYIGIDSASGPSPDRCPGGEDEDGEWVVPCMGIFGRGDPERRFGPDYSVQFEDQAHVEVVGSRESFVEQYKFFTGAEPRTTQILPEPPGKVDISGRAQNFPANTPLAGSPVEVWEVQSNSGKRIGDEPVADLTADEDGFWGPVEVDPQAHYEIAVTRDDADGGDYTMHYYAEPFIRSNHLVRLNVAPADSPLAGIVERGEDQSVVVYQRQKEWFADHPTDSDQLKVSPNSHSDETLQLMTEGTAPVSGSTIGIITWDAGSDGVSDPTGGPLAAFVSRVDVNYPAADPPDASITAILNARGEDRQQMLLAPNWSSSSHGITFSFRDWTQDPTTWQKCVRSGLCRR